MWVRTRAIAVGLSLTINFKFDRGKEKKNKMVQVVAMMNVLAKKIILSWKNCRVYFNVEPMLCFTQSLSINRKNYVLKLWK